MSDEELVQCPNNPNHQIPRSQIDEHVKTCKFLIDPNQETQITFSSYDEPRPSTSYQESPQEASSHQGESQLATLPISGSTSVQKWRSPKKTEIKETSPSKLKRLKPYPKPLKSREISTKSGDSSKSDLFSDKLSKKGLLAMRKETYLKELSKKRKDLKKLKIDSSSDDNSSSSTDSALSLEDTMSENKEIILYEMGLEFKSQIPSTSQQTDSSQQAASSQQAVILQPPKLTLEKKDEKMDDESSVDPSSRFLPEPSDPLEFEMEEPSLPEDVPQEQSESVSSYAETSDDSIDLQRLSRKRKVEHEKMDTEEIVEVKGSHLLAEVTTPLEVELEELSSSKETPLQESQQLSFHTALSYHSDVSDQLKMISNKKREEMDTEENIVAEASHTLSEVTTQLEVELEEPSLVADVLQQQILPFSFHAASTSDSDYIVTTNDESQQADISQQESSSLQEDNSLHEVSSLQEDSLPQKGSLLQEDNSLHEVSSLQEDSLPQKGNLLQADNTLHEVSSLQEDSLPQKGSLLQEDNSLHGVSSLQEDSLPQKGSLLQADNTLHEVSSLQEDSLQQGGSLLQEDNSLHEVSLLQEDSLPKKGSLLQADNTLHEVSSLQEDSLSQGGSLLQEDSLSQGGSLLQEDSLSQGGSLLQEDSSQQEESCGEETADMLDYLHSIDTGSSESTSSFQEEQSESVVSHDKAKHELNVPQEERRLRKRLNESSSESIDIVDLQKYGSSQEADISSETESPQGKTKFLAKRRRHESTSTTFEDKSKKIGFEKTYLSVPKEKSRPDVSRGKTKHQLDIPQEASKLRKRSYETSSESTDIDIGDLQEAGSSLKSDISPKAYGSPKKRKCLEIRRRYDSSSSTDEDKDEKKGI